jgi:hypothetical protein
MEGLIRGVSVPTEMSPLLVEQQRVGDEYRVVEKAIDELRNMLASPEGCPDRATMEEGVVARTTDLLLLRQRMLELVAAVTVASLQPS